MRKLLFLVTFLLLSLGLAACGNTDKAKEKQEVNETPVVETENDGEKDATASNTEESPLTIEENDKPIDKPIEEKNYEVVHSKSENKFPVLFVTVPDQNTDNLTRFAQDLKSEYPSSDVVGVNVIFFTEDDRQEAIDNNSDHAFAKLIVNYKGNVSKLVFFNDQKPVQIK